VSDTADLITWYRTRLDNIERWARAANQVYTYAEGSPAPPESGVHWTWVKGENWTPTNPDPVTEEFVGDATGEWRVNLATVEEWPSRISSVSPARPTRQTYAGTIEEMDPSAAGHIVLHDPAAVLRRVAAERAVLDLWGYSDEHAEFPNYDGGHAGALEDVVRALAQQFAGEPGYREEWTP